MAKYKLVRTLEAEGQEKTVVLNKGGLLYLAAKAYDFQVSLAKQGYEIESDDQNEFAFSATLVEDNELVATLKYQIIKINDEQRGDSHFSDVKPSTKPSKTEKKKAKKEKKAARIQVLQTGKTVNGNDKAFTNNPVLFEGGPEEVSSFCSDYCARMADSGADVKMVQHGFIVTRQIAAGELALMYEIKSM